MGVVARDPAAVIGPDLEGALVQNLLPDDKILAEVNGIRIFSKHHCPLVSDKVWTVEANSRRALVLSYPGVRKRLFLPYESLLAFRRREQPAVFKISDPEIHPSTAYVILQMVSEWVTSDRVDALFPPPPPESQLREMLSFPSIREALVNEWAEMFQGFTDCGWGYKSICRFALRSGVKTKFIRAIRDNTGETVELQDLIKIASELHWMPYFFRAGGYAQMIRESENV